MAAFNWTKEQKQVIFTRDRNLLVSAAAGSGKTTVLVERVLQYLTDEAHPVDIDRLLIVTFTRAAASEMRTRLYKAISDRLGEQPENRHLRRQLRLIGSAQISTIDSFCSWVLSNYYQEISLDPSFRVGDEGEMTLLKDDVLKKLLEEKYEEGSDEFLALSESFASGKNDDELRERLLRLFSYSESAPYPDEWLQESLKPYYAESTDDLLESAWLKQYTESLKAALSDCVKKAEAILEICKKPMGPAYAYETFSEDIPGIRRAAEAVDFRDLQEKAAAIVFGRKPNKPKTGVDPVLEDKAAKARKKLKDRIDSIREKTAQSLEETLAILKTLRPRAETFIGLTRDFARAFAAEKRKRNLVDYSDLEHLTIQILKQDGKRTAVARLLSKRFEEIMVDEYQDSNFVQEEILTAVSRMEEGRNNIFMVGDMKQSIYRFRMARPELFTEKYETYTREDSDKQLIELDNNFRSGTPVIDSVNEVFRLLMHKSVGGIEYDAAAELKIGPQKEQEAEKAAVFDRTTQFLLYVPEEEDEEETGSGESTGSTGSGKPAGSQSDALNPTAQITKPAEKTNGLAGKTGGPAGKANDSADSPGEDFSKDQDERTGIEKEAVTTALEILKLTSSGTAPQIYDEALKAFRPVSYGDIVILLRSSKNTDTIFAEALEDAGIPVYLESRQGYFETWEVRLVLDFLRVIDNPVQDIPLASLMHSMLFSFSSEEMAEIAVSYQEKEEGNGFYGAVLNYEKSGQNEALRGKIRHFLDTVESYRKLSVRVSLSALISAIISEQELDIYAAALPGGAQRTRNLNALNARAETFEQTSYHGIFHFIRYIERLMKSDTDAGEPGASEESGNAVRIMTVHKSKGLEFPVVFLCGLGKRMNKQELGNGVIMHPVLGVGMDLIHYDTRVREKCLLRTALRDQLERENVGEELRVLYVAMTRARDRLYLTANAPSLEKLLKDYGDLWEQEPEVLSDTELLGASNMLDWLLRAWREGSSLDLKLIRDEDLLYEALRTEDAEKQVRTALESELMPEDEASDRIRDTARETFSYQYRYDDLYTVRPTMSVSMLKMEHIEELQEESEPLFADVPAGENGGARRGTLYHLVMERSDPEKKAEENISRLIREGALTEEEAAMIDPVKIDAFFGSDVGKRFIRARENGKAFREKSFIIGVPAAGVRKVKLVRNPEELVMIQGIIDMYFEEDGELVVVDYKTDRVREARELIDRYQLQLELYERALEQITGKKVREKIIWSFALNCEIPV